MYVHFSGMPCLEGENNGFSYLLPQVDYSPHAFSIPVALTSKVLTVNKQNSARHGFTRGGCCSRALAPSPAGRSAGSPAPASTAAERLCQHSFTPSLQGS